MEDALKIAIAIADALDKAHRAGVTHRDLKPSNIMLTKSGPKLLDFGLARLDADVRLGREMASESRTITTDGQIVGTLQYMAPEQLEGKKTDARTDIFAFGTVLYEMITGRRAFEGTSSASLVAAILEHEPQSVSETEPQAPPLLDHIVKTCLAKNPDDRWQTAGDLFRQLRWIAATRNNNDKLAAHPPTRISFLRSALLLLFLVTAAVIYEQTYRSPNSGDAHPMRVSLDVTPADSLMFASGARPARSSIAISPNGHHLAFIGTHDKKSNLYIRALDETDAQVVPDSEGVNTVFFSPDGQWIGFFAGRKIRKVAIAGGPPIDVCEAGFLPPLDLSVHPLPWGGSWSIDDTIIYSLGEQGLWQVPSASGTPKQITKPNPGKNELRHVLPHVLPDGKSLLFTIRESGGWDNAEIVVQSLETGMRRSLIRGASDGRYVRTGHLVYMKSGNLMAIGFDLQKLETSGAPVAMVESVMHSVNMYNENFETGEGQFSVSASGNLLFLSGGIHPPLDEMVVTVDREGNENESTIPLGLNYRFSPDGRKVAYADDSQRTAEKHVWVYDIQRNIKTRLTAKGHNGGPVWSPDGKRIAFFAGADISGQRQLFWTAADGTGQPEPLFPNDHPRTATSWSGPGLVYVEYSSGVTYDEIWVLPMIGQRKPVRFLHSPNRNVSHAELSPDGKWMAYHSPPDLYVQAYPAGGDKHLISDKATQGPIFSRDGRELFYGERLSDGESQILSVEIQSGSSFKISKPRPLFKGPYGWTTPTRTWDVSPDGRQFLMLKSLGPSKPVTQIQVVMNWFSELEQRVP